VFSSNQLAGEEMRGETIDYEDENEGKDETGGKQGNPIAGSEHSTRVPQWMQAKGEREA
jgi:hypothetical protein